jgi:hypothetical protein
VVPAGSGVRVPVVVVVRTEGGFKTSNDKVHELRVWVAAVYVSVYGGITRAKGSVHCIWITRVSWEDETRTTGERRAASVQTRSPPCGDGGARCGMLCVTVAHETRACGRRRRDGRTPCLAWTLYSPTMRPPPEAPS